MLRTLRNALQKNLTKDVVFSCLSGILLALAFPKTSFSILGWIGFVPLLLVFCRGDIYDARRNGPDKSSPYSFLLGLMSGTVAFCGILYWLVPTFITAGESVFVGIFSLLFLSIYIGLYTGLFCLFAGLTQGLNNYLKLFFVPCLWVALEYARARLFGGFPWGLLGYTQWNFPQIIQVCDITGVYGVSFIVMLVNTAIVLIIKNRKYRIQNATTAICTFFLVFAYGQIKLKSLSSTLPAFRVSVAKVALLQGNIDQYKKWDERYIKEIMDTYSALSDEVAKSGVKPDLIVWPESSVPGYLLEEKNLYDWVGRLARKTRCSNLVGSVSSRGEALYNSAFLISKKGELIDSYDKIHLVPFGEYIPLQGLLAKFVKVVNQLGGFSPGKRYTLFDTGGKKFVVNICFEAIFPELVRKSVNRTIEAHTYMSPLPLRERIKVRGDELNSSIGFIVNITNDGWYLNTSAPYQHFIFNVFRAVENRKPVIRCANTGISGLIDSCGRIIEKTDIFKKTVKFVSVHPDGRKSFYTRFGDIFASVCIIFLIIIILLKNIRKI